MTKRKKGPTPRVERWAPWFEDDRSPLSNGERLFGNGWWTVHVTVLDEEAGWDGPLQLSIHDRPRSTRHDWREFQRVKNAVVGEEREAVELYPAEERLVDTANEYHLWVAPTGKLFPFGFEERSVSNGDRITKAVLARAAEAGLVVDPGQLHKARQRARKEES